MGPGYTHTISFGSGGTMIYSYSDGSPSTYGTYSVSGNSVTITLSGPPVIGTISGNTLTFGGSPHTKVG
ncbi:MAG: lipocalin family protein [Treponema sp.]|jgi:hypothetical protein|nr:lipocalin family protein [Treponema sp.]